ncbi:hypothetical protein BFP70_06110 [Thioclava sp. SK-1]|nr:hypothetical protein BFP70_06110 [Thioclava sp. SK-1]
MCVYEHIKSPDCGNQIVPDRKLKNAHLQSRLQRCAEIFAQSGGKPMAWTSLPLKEITPLCVAWELTE